MSGLDSEDASRTIRWVRPHLNIGADGVDYRYHAVDLQTKKPICGARVQPLNISKGRDEKPPAIANRYGHENPVCEGCESGVEK